MLSILGLQVELAACYVRGVGHMMRLPRMLRQPTELSAVLAELAPGSAVEVDVPAAEVEAYNELMARTKASCLAAGPHLWLRDYEKQLLPAMIALRLVATAVALWLGPSGAWVALTLLAAQLVVAPLSLVPAVSTLVALAQPMFVGHYVVYPLLSTAIGGMADPLLVAIDNRFILAFVVVDQLLCLLCLFWNPGGTPAAVTRKQITRSVLYGFVNCKTYNLILFGLLRGSKVDVLVLALDGALGLTGRVCDAVRATGYNWSTLFYHQHRLAHLPCVYQHAHKFHHSLQGTTPFDAHLYGNGMPEELGTFALEYGLAAAFGIAPATLNARTLYHSWTDKVGHTLKEVNKDGCNAHPEHHIYHTKNYGIFDMGIDLLYGTCADNNTGMYQAPHGCTITRSEVRAGDGARIRLTYEKPVVAS